MYFKELEEFDPIASCYNLKDKAYNHVMLRTMRAFEKAEEIRNGIQTVHEFIQWQNRNKKIFRESIGELPYDKALALNTRITGRIEEDALTIEKIIFEARERVYVTANLYIP